jgi:hypothetical protein
MLNRHPRIGLCDESYFYYWVAQRAHVFGDLADAGRRAHAVECYLATRRIRRLGLDLNALRRRLLDEASSYPAFFLSLLQFYAASHDKVRCGEKTPQHSLVTSKLLEWYPRAQVVHLVRDPRDVVSSLMRMPWGSRSVWANAELWRNCVTGAEQPGDCKQVLRVQFELLVEQPRAELERLCTFLGEDFAAEMLDADAPAKSDRWWFDRAQGNVDRGRIERWRSELTEADVALVEACVGDLLQRHGYSPAAAPARILHRTLARAKARWAGFALKVKQRKALYFRWLRPDQLAAEEAVIDGHTD